MHMNLLKKIKQGIQDHKITSLLSWVITLQLMGYFMGQLTQDNITPWYDQLLKSSLTPPPITFAIVWPILYTVLAIIGSTIFSKHKTYSKKIKYLYSVQLILNWAWTPIFFHLHWVGTALFVLSSILFLTSALTIDIYAKNKKMFFLLTPYLIWIAFATYLNAVIWIHA